MLLAELVELLKVEMPIAVSIVHAENAFRKALGQIFAFGRMFLNQSFQFSFLEISIAVFVVLKIISPSKAMSHNQLGHQTKPHLVENSSNALTLGALLSGRIKLHLR